MWRFRRSALQGDARGDTDGGELNALANLGYDLKHGGFTFGPIASFNYTYVGTSDFTVHGPELGRDSLLLGAGLAVHCSERCSTYLYYDGELGRRNYQSTAVTGGFRIAF